MNSTPPKGSLRSITSPPQGPASGPRRAESGELAIPAKIAIAGVPRRLEVEQAFIACGYQVKTFSRETKAYQVISYDAALFHIDSCDEAIDIALAMRVMRYPGRLVVMSRVIRNDADVFELKRAGVSVCFRYPCDFYEVAQCVEHLLSARTARPSANETREIERTLEIERLELVLSAGELRVARLLASAEGKFVRWETIDRERNSNRDSTQTAMKQIRKKLRHLPIWLETKYGFGVALRIQWL